MHPILACHTTGVNVRNVEKRSHDEVTNTRRSVYCPLNAGAVTVDGAPTTVYKRTHYGGIPIGIVIGMGWFMLRYIVTSFYTVNQNGEDQFCQAQRLSQATTLALPWPALRPDERNGIPGLSCA